MDEKKYLINNEPASARDIIDKALRLDPLYGHEDGICFVSVAAEILRRNGYTVEEVLGRQE